MDVEGFLRKEKEIFGAMESRGLKVITGERGVEAKLPREGFNYGYIIFLTYSNKTSKAIQSVSEKVNDRLGAITYGLKRSWGGNDHHELSNVHTTLGTYSTGSGNLFEPDHSIIRTLGEATQEAISEGIESRQRSSTPYVRFDQLIHDESTVLLRPIGDADTFYPLMKSITSNAKGRGIDLKPSWGRHITVSRFKKDIPPSEELTRNLDELVYLENILLMTPSVFDERRGEIRKKDPFVEDYARSVNVGFFALSSSQFILEPCISYHFNPIRSPGMKDD